MFYEEFPYLVGRRADAEVRQVLRGRKLDIQRFTLPVDREVKASRIGAYHSQVELLAQHSGRVDEVANLPHMERYWLVTRHA